jgi:hypothetical protein
MERAGVDGIGVLGRTRDAGTCGAIGGGVGGLLSVRGAVIGAIHGEHRCSTCEQT